MLAFQLAELVGIFTQAVLFGVYLVTLGFCLASFQYDRRLQRVDVLVLGVVLVMGFLSTLEISLNMSRMVGILTASISSTKQDLSLLEGPDMAWKNVTRGACLSLQTILGDAVLIWRCWVIHDYKIEFVILSFLMWLGAIALAIRIQILYSSGLGPALLTAAIFYWSLTVALNASTTGLIFYRLWRHEREVTTLYSGHHTPIRCIRGIVMDSGILYFSSTLCVLITQVLQSEGLFITTAMEIMITSIAFNLIIIRVAKLRKEESKLAPFRGDLTLTSIRFATSERCESSDNREEGIDLDIEGDPREGRKKWRPS